MSFDLKIIAGDLQIKSGNLETLTGSNKLQQDIVKIATTELGADPLNPWYGSMVSQSLIGNPLPDDIKLGIAQSQLTTAIETLKSLQELQTSYGQKVTPDELISYIRGISIVRNDQDLRVIHIMISVLNRAFRAVATSINV